MDVSDPSRTCWLVFRCIISAALIVVADDCDFFVKN